MSHSKEVQNSPNSNVHVTVAAAERARSNWKMKAIKVGAPIVAGAVAFAYVSDRMPDFGAPFRAIGNAAHEIGTVVGDTWDGAIGIIGHGKSGANEAARKISKRHAEPLQVKPEDVIKGKIQGKMSFGYTEREYRIKDASKKYNTWVPGGDEWLHLKDGVFVGEAHVPGNIAISAQGNVLSVVMPAPEMNPDLITRRIPHDGDNAQLVAKGGQFFGAHTSAEQAYDELKGYVSNLEHTDIDLQKAAACWGGQTVLKGVLEPTLTSLNYSVSTVSTPEDTQVPVGPNHEFIDLQMHMPNTNSVLHIADCEPILQQTTILLNPASDPTIARSSLPAQYIDNVTLKQG